MSVEAERERSRERHESARIVAKSRESNERARRVADRIERITTLYRERLEGVRRR